MTNTTKGQDPWKEQLRKKKEAALMAENEYKKGNSGAGKVWTEQMKTAAKTAREGDIKSWGKRDWMYNPEGKWVIQPVKPKTMKQKKTLGGWARQTAARVRDRITKGSNPYKGLKTVKKDK